MFFRWVVGTDGSIYLAGKASAEIKNLGGDIKELRAADNGMKSGKCDHTFITKLSPDASQAIGIRHLTCLSNAPKLELLHDGSLQFTAFSHARNSPTLAARSANAK